MPGDQWSDTVPEDQDAKDAPRDFLPHKQSERIRGFLIYVSRTYKSIVPFLKGLHLTLDFWRPNRDDDGWRVKANADPDDTAVTENHKAPRFVKVAPRLKADVRVLMDLTAFEEAPAINV